MKLVWEKADIVSGKQFSRHDIQEVWMIGALPSTGDIKVYVMVSLSDGLITSPLNDSAMAAMLTKEQYTPVEIS